MRTKLTVFALVVAFGVVLAIAAPVLAVPVAPGIWWEFSFTLAGVPATGCFPADPAGLLCGLGPGAVFVGPPPWTFVAPPEGAEFRITDAFCKGDRFDVFDGGALVVTTPAVPVLPCGSPGETADPVVAFADPAYSHSLFQRAPGAHSITVTPFLSPFGGGAAYFRWDPKPRVVAEPASMLLLGSGLIAVCGARRKLRQRLAS